MASPWISHARTHACTYVRARGSRRKLAMNISGIKAKEISNQKGKGPADTRAQIQIEEKRHKRSARLNGSHARPAIRTCAANVILSYLYRFKPGEPDGKTIVNIPRRAIAGKIRAIFLMKRYVNRANNSPTSLFQIL